jgi:hypothetical protein
MLFKICDERWNRDGEGESKMELNYEMEQGGTPCLICIDNITTPL